MASAPGELVDMTEQLAEEMRKKNEKMDRMCSAHEKINYPKENLKCIMKWLNTYTFCCLSYQNETVRNVLVVTDKLPLNVFKDHYYLKFASREFPNPSDIVLTASNCDPTGRPHYEQIDT